MHVANFCHVGFNSPMAPNKFLHVDSAGLSLGWEIVPPLVELKGLAPAPLTMPQLSLVGWGRGFQPAYAN